MRRRRIFFAILIGLTIIMFFDSGIRTDGSFNFRIESDVVHSASVSRNENFVIAVDDVELFKLVNLSGDVQIIGEDRADIAVDSNITAYASTEELAAEYLQQVTVVHDIIGNKAEVRLGPTSGRRNITGIVTDFVILAPQDLVYDLELRYGTVELENLHGGVTAMINYADNINITDLNGDANLIVSYSDGFIDGIGGKLNLKVSYSELSVTKISDNMNLESRYSDINISDLDGDLVINSAFDDLEIENISGAVVGHSTYSSVNGLDVGTNKHWEMSDGSLKLLTGNSN